MMGVEQQEAILETLVTPYTKMTKMTKLVLAWRQDLLEWSTQVPQMAS